MPHLCRTETRDEMTGKLTKKAIEAAIAAGTGGKAYITLSDGMPPGFGLRIRQSGGASWLYRYRPKGAARGTATQSLTLGTWPTMSVEAARTLAIAQAGIPWPAAR